MCKRICISGHGSFNESYLESAGGRKKKGTFTVPIGATVTTYAPDGAMLDNSLANVIEKGAPAPGMELRQTDGAKTIANDGYPKVFTAGKEVVNYTVSPPEGLRVEKGALTVKSKTSLKVLVDDCVKEGKTDIHYVCCSAGFSDNKAFRDLFPGRGYYARIKM